MHPEIDTPAGIARPNKQTSVKNRRMNPPRPARSTAERFFPSVNDRIMLTHSFSRLAPEAGTGNAPPALPATDASVAQQNSYLKQKCNRTGPPPAPSWRRWACPATAPTTGLNPVRTGLVRERTPVGLPGRGGRQRASRFGQEKSWNGLPSPPTAEMKSHSACLGQQCSADFVFHVPREAPPIARHCFHADGNIEPS